MSYRVCAALALFAVVLVPAQIGAQTAERVAKIGVAASSYGPRGECVPGAFNEGFMRGLMDLGWVSGKNIAFDVVCYANADEMRTRVGEFVNRKVDLIFAGPPAMALAAKHATQQIPVVCGSCGDPLAIGLVASLGRPGGNVTGMASLSAEMIGKRLSLLKEMLPGAKSITVLLNPENPGTRPMLQALEQFAPRVGLGLAFVEFRRVSDFPEAVRAAAALRAAAMLVQDDPFTFAGRKELAAETIRHRIVAFAGQPESAEAGELIAYGPNRVALATRAAGFADKILKGAKAGDLPFEQPTKFDFVINLRTAKALGIKVPQSVLLQATRLIE